MRQKIKINEITRDDFLTVVDEIARLELAIGETDAVRKRAINDIEKRTGEALKGLKAQLKPLLLQASAYAQAHAGELFAGGKKSAASPAAVYGFRTDTPSLKTLEGLTFEEVARRLREAGETAYVRESIALQKEPLLAAALKIEDEDERSAWLQARCLKIAQGEHFFVKPKTGDKTEEAGS